MDAEEGGASAFCAPIEEGSGVGGCHGEAVEGRGQGFGAPMNAEEGGGGKEPSNSGAGAGLCALSVRRAAGRLSGGGTAGGEVGRGCCCCRRPSARYPFSIPGSAHSPAWRESGSPSEETVSFVVST